MKMEASDNRATEVVLNEKGFNFFLKPFLEFSGLYSPKNALTILFKKLPHPPPHPSKLTSTYKTYVNSQRYAGDIV